MPVNATPATPQILTRDDVRGFLRDYAGDVPDTGQTNILLDNVEFSDADIMRAIKFTVARYNAITPVSTIGEGAINAYVLLLGVASWLMRSESMRQLRNQASVQDADVAPIGVDDKAQLYAQFSKLLSDDFQEYARKIKIQRNMESVYGGLGSGYRGTGRSYG